MRRVYRSDSYVYKSEYNKELVKKSLSNCKEYGMYTLAFNHHILYTFSQVNTDFSQYGTIESIINGFNKIFVTYTNKTECLNAISYLGDKYYLSVINREQDQLFKYDVDLRNIKYFESLVLRDETKMIFNPINKLRILIVNIPEDIILYSVLDLLKILGIEPTQLFKPDYNKKHWIITFRSERQVYESLCILKNFIPPWANDGIPLNVVPYDILKRVEYFDVY